MEMGVKRSVLIFLKRKKAEMALGMFEVLWMWQILSRRSRPHFRTFWGDVKRWREKASVLMQRLSYLTETVLFNKITRNRIVLSF